MAVLKASLVSVFTLVLGPRTEAWPEGCSASTKSNDLKTSALLFAHRCYLKVKLALDFCISFSRVVDCGYYLEALQFEKEAIICNL